ncbi:galactokinase [Rubritalea marina]|uniref:galactokinase n=1 Tax=Rubritalea marina TaxID=361055 RepID=UPI0003719190|nr:galactokinase [Rubritalea marina]
MIQENIIQFETVFGTAPDFLAQAPGRLEILGNHTDYNEGFVLSMAVDRRTQISFKKIEGNRCQVFSPMMSDGVREFELDAISTPLPSKDWTNYVRGIVTELQKRDHKVGAFQALITSDIPLSAGMSSSASLEMALVTGIDTLFGFDLSTQEKAQVGQACENDYIGANTGLMDQLTSLSGKDGEMVVSEYRNISISHTPLPSELSFVVINSNVAHDLSQEYNERRQQCEDAVATIQKEHPEVQALRDVNLELLEAAKPSLAEYDHKRALHVVGENDRVHQAQSFLSAADYDAFGKLLFASHESSRLNFENSCPELDTLVEIAAASPLCLGARLSGGGFGGISIHLVRSTDAEAYCDHAIAAYTKATGKDTTAFICRSAQGAGIESYASASL